MLGLSITACVPKKAAGESQDERVMLVGTYTNGTSKGIYTFRFNQETGVAVPLDSIELPNPSYLVPSGDGKLIYAVSETNDSRAALNTLSLNQSTGGLRLLNTELTHGADPCYVATNGKAVLTANYSGGSMSVFSLRANGVPAAMDTLFEGSATGPDALRQATPHLHCTVYSPDGKYIFATDFSADRILRYVLPADGIIPRLSTESTAIEPGSGPRHLTFSPDGRHAYLITELSGKVLAFRYEDGHLEQIQAIVADTVSARGSADIHLSPDGKYLYASNRLKEDGIAIFAVNPENGTLAKVGYRTTGIHPRNFNITPNGKYLLVACRDSNVIQVYRRDENTGLLIDVHRDIAVDKPVCVQFTVSVNNP